MQKVTPAGMRWVTMGGRKMLVSDKGAGGAKSPSAVKNEGQKEMASSLELTRKFPKEFPAGSKVTSTNYSATTSSGSRDTATVVESHKADFAVVTVSRQVSTSAGQKWEEKTFKGGSSTLDAHRFARKTLGS